jgi:hypothetical protein
MTAARRTHLRKPKRTRRTHTKLALERLWNPIYGMSEREASLIMGLMKREKTAHVRPGEFELDAGNAVNRFVGSELGLDEPGLRNKVICVADGLTASQILSKQRIKTANWLVGDRHIEGNVLKRLLEDAIVAIKAHEEIQRGKQPKVGWAARHTDAQLAKISAPKSKKIVKIEVDTSIFKIALKEMLGKKDYKYFMSRRGELMRAAKRMWGKV